MEVADDLADPVLRLQETSTFQNWPVVIEGSVAAHSISTFFRVSSTLPKGFSRFMPYAPRCLYSPAPTAKEVDQVKNAVQLAKTACS